MKKNYIFKVFFNPESFFHAYSPQLQSYVWEIIQNQLEFISIYSKQLAIS